MESPTELAQNTEQTNFTQMIKSLQRYSSFISISIKTKNTKRIALFKSTNE